MLASNEPDDSFELQLERAFNYCEKVVINSSTSFSRSINSLPFKKKRAVNALYAFCRRVDDIADGDWLNPNIDLANININKYDLEGVEENKIERLASLLWFKKCFEKTLKGEQIDEPIFIAIKKVMNQYPIRSEDLMNLISGMEEDLFHSGYNTWEEMEDYCYKVASSVGFALIEIYGYKDEDIKEKAKALGIFLQMINILRDVNEDLDRGRLYFPKEELLKHGIDPLNFISSISNNPVSWNCFLDEYLERARGYRNIAIQIIPLLDQDSRRAPELMLVVYDAILAEAERREGLIIERKLQLGLVKKMDIAMMAMGIRKVKMNYSSNNEC